MALDRSTARIVWSPHPIVAQQGRTIVHDAPRPAETVEAYLQRNAIPVGRVPLHVALNDTLLGPGELPRRAVRAGDVLTVRAGVDGGPGPGGEKDSRQTVATVFSLALLVTAPGISNVWLRALYVVAGSYIIDSFREYPQPFQEQRDESPTYSIRGGRNRARPGQPMPVVFGTHRVVPDMGAQPYTKVSWGPYGKFNPSNQGDSLRAQEYYQVFHFGVSDLTLTEMKIGNSPVAEFDAQLETSGDDGALSLFPTTVQSDQVDELFDAPRTVIRTTAPDCTGITVDLAGTLYEYNDGAGRYEDHVVDMRLQFREVGTSTWIDFLDHSPSGNNDEFVIREGHHRRNFRRSLAAKLTGTEPKQYEVRLERRSSSPSDTGADSRVSDVVWSRLLSFQRDTADYDGQRRVAMKIVAGRQAQNVIEEFSALAAANQRIPQVGGGTVTGTTSNPAWHFYEIARGRTDSQGRRLYGGMLPESQLDMDAILEWGQFCTDAGLTCDLVFDRPVSVDQALRTVARCGRAIPTWGTGKLGVVWDAPEQPATAVYGMGNILAGSFSVSYVSQSLTDELVGTFINRDANWTLDEVRVLAPGVTTPVRSARVELMGVTTEAQAAREINLMMAENEYRRRRITWETDMEGLTSTLGDVVILSHDLTVWGYSGRLVAGENNSVTLDRAVPFTAGESHWLLVVEPDGAYSHHPIDIETGEAATLTLTNAMDSVTNSEGNAVTPPDQHPDSGALDYRYAFAPEATPGKRVKLMEIDPAGPDRIRLTAVDEDPDYYTAEDGTYEHTTPPDYVGRAPSVSNITFEEQLVTRDGLTRVRIEWELAGSDATHLRVQVDGKTRESVQKVLGDYYELVVPTGTQLDVEASPAVVAPVQTPGPPATASYTVQGKLVPPGAVTGFGAAVDGPYIKLSWDRGTEIDLADYELRRGGTDWDSAELVERIAHPQTEYRHTPTQAGVTTFRVKKVDTSGIESVDAGVINFAVEAHAAPSSVDVQVIDNNVLLNWQPTPSGTFGRSHYRVHVGTDIDNPDQTYEVDGRFANLNFLEAGDYTFHIFAVDIAGIEGAAATVTATMGQPPGFVLRTNQNSAFDGTLTNMVLSRGGLFFPVVTGETIAQHFDNNGWTTPQDQVDAGYEYWIQPGATSADYEEIIDLGGVVGTSQVIVTPTWSVLDGSVSIETTLSVRESSGDPWSVGTPGNRQMFATDFRYIRIQIAATADGGGNDLAQMNTLNTRVQAKLSTESGKATSDAANPVTITFSKSFVDVTNINVTPWAGTTQTSVVVDFNDVPNPVSADVYIFDDNNGTQLAVPFGYDITGYL